MPLATSPTPSSKAPVALMGATVSTLQWNHFIPPADPFFKQQAADWGKQTGVAVSVETINSTDLTPRFTAALNAQSGPTIFQMPSLGPHLFARGLRDVGDLAREIEPSFGKYYPQANSTALVDGTYRAIPYNFGASAFVFRKSYFARAGVANVPESWDEFRDAVRKLAAIGKPVGQSFAQTFSDAQFFLYPLWWSFGGKEVEDDGRTVAINSTETLDALRFAKACWDDGLDRRALSWDDSGNNTAFLADEISCTLNAASIYFVGAGLDGRSSPTPWADDMEHFLSPKGAHGRFSVLGGFSHGIPNYVTGRDLDATREFLRHIYAPAQFDPLFELQKGYGVGPGERMESHPMWETLPKPLAQFRLAGRTGRAFGYPGQPTEKTSEVHARYVIVNMFARVVQGTSPEDSVRQAEAEMKHIYAV